MNHPILYCTFAVAAWFAAELPVLRGEESVQISGRYPHLAVFNHGDECGIGAVVPWNGKLWAITYSPHKPTGSDDKLYSITEALEIAAHPESIGGTPANRMIHRESNQLIIGPYFIDAKDNVRVVPYTQALGRPTATARHLTEPAKKVLHCTMEEGLYEIDVATLEVASLEKDAHAKGFRDPIPGYHGKGGYTSQGRLVVSNNGERGPTEILYGNAGCLAEWDGKNWTVVEEKQFCEVTGPGGIYGNAAQDDPLWATGWDKRSVILQLLDGGKWHTYRLPIGDYSYVARHGWYTEWPRIREVVPARDEKPAKLLMNMHGLWFDFPQDFRAGQTGGLRPIASYLKITADFCDWNGRIVFAFDDTAITGGNKFVNQSQSNFWFARWDSLGQAGKPAGWGGPWVGDDVRGGEPSAPYLFAGFDRRVLHLSHQTDGPVNFAVELSQDGNQWRKVEEVSVPARGYRYLVFENDLAEAWIRLAPQRDASGVTAYFHYGPGGGAEADPSMFDSLAEAGGEGRRSVGIVRPRGDDCGTLQLLAWRSKGGQAEGEPLYYEMGPDMKLRAVADAADSVAFLQKTAPLDKPDFAVDEASVVVTERGKRWRLPKTDEAYDEPWAMGWPRGKREVVTERRLFNCHGTLYLLPHDSAGGITGIKPVSTHGKHISDFCSWRGLLVLAGVKGDARPGDHTLVSEDGRAAVWCGDVDDLWKLGKPRGTGGPWKNTAVKAGEPSDAYLMTGFDRKKVELSHDSSETVSFTLEVDFLRDGTWVPYQQVEVPAGKTVAHVFPDGFSAHWVRVVADRPAKATAWFTYE